MRHFLNRPQATPFLLTNYIKSHPSCYRKAQKTISVQDSVPIYSRVHHRQHGQQEPSQLMQKWVGWMANIFYVCLFFFDINSPTRDAFTHGEAHFDALMSGKQEFAQSWDQKGDLHRVQLSNVSFISLSTQSWQPDECTLSHRPSLLKGVRKCRNVLQVAGFSSQRQVHKAIKRTDHERRHVDTNWSQALALSLPFKAANVKWNGTGEVLMG